MAPHTEVRARKLRKSRSTSHDTGRCVPVVVLVIAETQLRETSEGSFLPNWFSSETRRISSDPSLAV